MIAALADIETYLGLSSPTALETALLTLLHNHAERMVKAYVRSNIEEATYTEYYPVVGTLAVDSPLIDNFGVRKFGEQRTTLHLKQVPVRSITYVYENSAAYGIAANWTSSHLLTAGTHYWLDVDESGLSKSGILNRLGGSWPYTARSVKVTYVAGYDEDELAVGAIGGDFVTACILTTVKLWNEALAQQGGDVGEGFGPIAEEEIENWKIKYNTEATKLIAGLSQTVPDEVADILQNHRVYSINF